jgi:hypothetical protein
MTQRHADHQSLAISLATTATMKEVDIPVDNALYPYGT